MRRSLLPMLALLAALTGSAAGKDRVYRVGVLTPTGTGAGFDSVRSVTLPELAQLGFVEGRNLVIEIRAADGVLDRLPALARELVQTAPDVIIANAPPAIRATREATGTIPIVMSFAGEDPVAAGWVASLSHPGGNVTGLVLLGPELDGKRLQLLHEAIPDRRRIAVLVEPGLQGPSLQEMRSVAQALGLELITVAVVEGNYVAAFETIRLASAGALALPSSAVFLRDVATIASLAAESAANGPRWPARAASSGTVPVSPTSGAARPITSPGSFGTHPRSTSPSSRQASSSSRSTPGRPSGSRSSCPTLSWLAPTR